MTASVPNQGAWQGDFEGSGNANPDQGAWQSSSEPAAGGITGTGAITLGGMTTAGVGATIKTGSGAVTFGALTTAGVGSVAGSIMGNGAINLGALITAGVGVTIKTGSGAITFGALTTAGSGTVGSVISGNGAITLGALVAYGNQEGIEWSVTTIVNGSDIAPFHIPSRLNIQLNASNGDLHNFYQANQTNGKTYTKSLDITNPSISDPTSLGTIFIEKGTDGFNDPSCLTHPYTTGMGEIPVIAGNATTDDAYYNVIGDSAGGYFPIANANGDRTFAHTQVKSSWNTASDNKMWTMIMISDLWTIHEFIGTGGLSFGDTGGYTGTSAVVTDSGSGKRLSCFYQNDTMWSFNMQAISSRPRFERFDYSGGTWTRNISTQIRPTSGTDGLGTSKTSFSDNETVFMMMDQNDVPLLFTVGAVSDGFGSNGIQIACPVSAGSPGGQWQSTVIDPEPLHGSDVRHGAFQFKRNGVDKIGIIYANDITDKWYFMEIPTTTTLSEYVDINNWSLPLEIPGSPGVDDHCSVMAVEFLGAYYLCAGVKDAVSSVKAIIGKVGNSSIPGSGSVTMGALTTAGVGTVAQNITGVGDIDLGAITVAGVGTVESIITGSGAINLGALTTAGVGSVVKIVSGSGALTLGAMITAGVGIVAGIPFAQRGEGINAGIHRGISRGF